MLLQVDIDSTLYDADRLFRSIARERGVNWPNRYYKWFGPEDIGTDLKTLKSIFRTAHSREYVELQRPYPGAADTLLGIVNDYEDVEIAYVSDRNEQQSGALHDWLEKHGFLYSDDAHVAATKDKRHWMRERRPEVVIDDRVRTILMARYELGSYVVSLEHPHNMNLIGEAEHIYIVSDWREINRVLRETVLPKLSQKALSKTAEVRY